MNIEPGVICLCGHVFDEHSATGECQVDECTCACFEPEEEAAS